MLNTASPYLGFKTQNVFSMYSNLSTENYSSNHLLVKNGSLFGKFQNDLVIIGKTNIDKLKQHKIMVYEQMKNYVYEEFRKGKGNYEVLYIRNGKQINLKKEDFFKDGNLTLKYLKWKFFTFKPVSIYEKKHCGL